MKYDHSEKAVRLFAEGLNCAQAIFTAFADVTGMDEELAKRLSSSFGGGMGRMREVCGTCSGMFMVAGILYGQGTETDDKLKAAMAEITDAYFSICQSRKFIAELRRIRTEFQGRPTPISHLERLSNALGGCVQLYAKREDLNHSGAHKLNHCMGEALLAKYMGKKKVIAETGAGQHGVALATAAA